MALQKPDDYTPWEYFLSNYTRGSGAGSNRNIAAWGGAGMAGWGSTCGIAISCALVCELAMPRASTNGQIDKAFAHYCQDAHPAPECGNADWFVNHASRTRKKSTATPAARILGSLQCHNVVNGWRTDAAYHSDLGLTRDDARSEFCGRVVADMCYRTLKVLNNMKHGTPVTNTAFSTVRTTCSVSGCHESATTIPTGFLPKENCFACHK